MVISLPPTSKSLGRKVVVFLDTPPAAGTGIPTTVEVTAALFGSLHLYTPFNVTPNQNTDELLVPGTQLTVVVLDDMDGDIDAVVAGDVADIYLMECGVRRKGQTGDGEFDQFSVTQSLIVVGGEPVAEDQALAAA